MDFILETRNLTKSFSGIRVLDDISLRFHAGEIHALVGENGAGKSTLMKIVAGLHTPDSGELLLDGRPVRFRSAHTALKAGIAMVHQELLPFRDLTVAENIFMGREPTRFPGWIDRRALHAQTRQLLGQLGVTLDPSQPMRDLRVAELQTVEILKALAHEARLLILDEPTSSLSEREADALFRVIRDLCRGGTAIVYISHRLEEIFRLADRITVLRDGRHVATQAPGELNADSLIRLMVGRSVPPRNSPPATPPGDTALAVDHLSRAGRFQDVSFAARRGEIVGIAGLMGAGRTELLHALYGLDPADSGRIRVGGRTLRIRKPQDALRAGIGHVGEDRKLHGFVPLFGAQKNMTLASLRRWCRFGWIRRGSERQTAIAQIDALGIRTSGPEQPVVRLSGGNQQKVVLARSLLAEPDILLLDEPTRGIDVAAKAEVHALIHDLARAGKAIVLVSSELPELLSLSHRLLVMSGGRLKAELDPRTTTQEEILRYAMPT